MANEVSKIYNDIAELLSVAPSKAYHSVNSIMVETYRKIGQRIVEEEQGSASRAIKRTLLNFHIKIQNIICHKILIFR